MLTPALCVALFLSQMRLSPCLAASWLQGAALSPCSPLGGYAPHGGYTSLGGYTSVVGTLPLTESFEGGDDEILERWLREGVIVDA